MSHLSCRYCGGVFYTDTPDPPDEVYADYFKHISDCFAKHTDIPSDNSTLAERCKMPSPSQVQADIVEGGEIEVPQFAVFPTPEVDPRIAKLTPADREIYYSLGNAKQQATYLERQQVYGSCTRSHQEIGAAWTAYINNALKVELPPLKAYQVAHMLALFKIMRASKEFHEDNYVDGHNYFEFAHCMQRNGV